MQRLSKLDIINLANFHLGNTRPIINLEDESSVEAIVTRKNYDLALETILREYRWPFAQTRKKLELLEELTESEWGLAYKYPSDCVDFHRINNLSPYEYETSVQSYLIENRGDATAILTNRPEAVGEYTRFLENTQLFPADFSISLSLLLAYIIAPAVTSGDPLQLGKVAFDKYQIHSKRAFANAMNEGVHMQPPTTGTMRARV